MRTTTPSAVASAANRVQVNSPPTINAETLKGLASSRDLSSAITALMGNGGMNQNLRQYILGKLMLDGEGDPLMQIKSLGDSLALTAESILAVEWMARVAVATMIGVSKAGEVAASSPSLTGVVVGTVAGLPIAGASGFTETLRYLTTEVFVIMKAATVMLMALSFAFSTWIPSIPYVAHLFAVLGFFFAVIMTTTALQLWGAMHLTPARNDSFIGSETQGYLLILALFTRPVLSMLGLAFSFVVAQPIVSLINRTFLPQLLGNEIASGSISFFFLTIFALILYFTILKGVLMWVFALPQALPDQVLRIISAGIGDLGEGKALSQAEASGGAGRIAERSLSDISQATGENLKGHVGRHKDKVAAAAKAEGERIKALDNANNAMKDSGPGQKTG